MKLYIQTGTDHMTGRIFARGIVLECENDGEKRVLKEVFGERTLPNGSIADVIGSVLGPPSYSIHLKKGLPT